MSRALGLRLGVAVVSKITPPWNTEVGYGAVAFDGSVRLNDELVSRLGLSDRDVREGIEATLAKVRRRVPVLRGSVDPSELAEHLVVLVDDGLASGFTMRVAVEAVRGCGSQRVVIAVPTGSLRAAQALAPQVEDLYCANVRGGWRFAVAEAYEEWTDVDEAQAAAILARAREPA
jgi:predicted phosphoribosyltransferase